MAMDFESSNEEEFVFYSDDDVRPGPSYTKEAPMPASDGYMSLKAAFEARGIESLELTQEQFEGLLRYSEALDEAQSREFASARDAADSFGDEFDIEIVDNLRADDGTKLNGAATTDGKVLLDSALSGQQLTDVLVEEIAEAAYYSMIGTASQGDFGAEVEARLDGVVDAGVLASFQSADSGDTVRTSYGEVQANVTNEEKGQAANLYGALNQSHSLQDIKLANFGPFAKGFSNGKASDGDPTITGVDRSNVNISNLNNRFDLNNDGIKDTYKVFDVSRDDTSNNWNGSSAITIGSITDVTLEPTSQSRTLVAGQGEPSTTWVLRKEDTYKASSEFNWSTEVEKSLKATGSFAGFSAEVGRSESSSSGGAVTTGRDFKVASEVRDTYKIPAGKYAEGTVVSYGFHVATGDIKVFEEYLVTMEITNARSGTKNVAEIQAFKEVVFDDHYLGLVLTDFDVANQQNAVDLLGIG
ncbi:hypothetical protein V8J82_22465 [Gymnodinialimonas sp. 2305UL16-5]|uniref:hypothetical protein n=1 Tax=Gymnodinialimonas mytili TaxID=3126503 RepID=UPI0030AF383D